MSSPRFGRIVWVDLLDPQGRNPKCRPAVIITPDPEIVPDGVVKVVGVSTRLDAAPAEVVVALQWDPRGNCRTGLREQSIAVCSWVQTVQVTAIQGYAGMVPPIQMTEIARKMASG